jgi:Peptidase A4 family
VADEGIHQTEYPTGEIEPPIRYTVTPGIASQITLKTSPGEACILYREGEPDPAHHLKLYADQDGMIRFHVHPTVESEDLMKVVVEYEVGGKITRSPLELRTSSQPIPEFPALALQGPKSGREGASVRPALSEEEALHLADEELLKRGYPPRPNPKEAPEAFQAWRRAVSVPVTIVEPQIVSRPDIGHGFARTDATRNAGKTEPAEPTEEAGTTQTSFTNWSGFELNGAPGTYDWVSGMWNVPSVSGESRTHTYSLLWVGLDGDGITNPGITDLVQAGTGHENIDVGSGSISSYYAWTEFLPQQPSLQQIANFAIHPGDEIFVEVFIGGAGSSPDLTGFFGQFWVQNLTTSESTIIYTPRGSTTVVGSEAVWIMERTQLTAADGTVSYGDLANYGTASIFNAWARRTHSPRHQGYVSYQGDTNVQITMFNSSDSDTLSTVTPVDTVSMRFSWHAFH